MPAPHARWVRPPPAPSWDTRENWCRRGKHQRSWRARRTALRVQEGVPGVRGDEVGVEERAVLPLPVPAGVGLAADQHKVGVARRHRDHPVIVRLRQPTARVSFPRAAPHQCRESQRKTRATQGSAAAAQGLACVWIDARWPWYSDWQKASASAYWPMLNSAIPWRAPGAALHAERQARARRCSSRAAGARAVAMAGAQWQRQARRPKAGAEAAAERE